MKNDFPVPQQQKFDHGSGIKTTAKPISSPSGEFVKLPGPGWYRHDDRSFAGGSEADDQNCTNATFDPKE
jgi:hypothetical protein